MTSSENLSRLRQLRWSFVALLPIVLVMVGMAYRQFYGVDLTDESYYAANEFKFARGGRFLVDEILLHQSASLLTTPLIWALDKLQGDMTGAILVLRLTYLLFAACMAGLVTACLKYRVSVGIAIWPGLLCLVFAPGNLFTFSYNTQGMLLLAVSLLTSLASITSLRRGVALAAGLSGGLACFSYPPLAAPLTVAWLILMWRFGRPAWRLAQFALLGASVPCAALMALLANVGLQQIRMVLSYQTSHGGGLEKLELLATRFFGRLPLWPAVLMLLALACGMGLLARNQRRAATTIVAVLATGWPMYVMGQGCLAPMWYVLHFGLFGPFALACVPRENRWARDLFWCVWTPSLLAGFLTAWSSHNASVNAAVGLLPGMIVTAVLLAIGLADAWRDATRFPLGQLLPQALLLLIFCTLAVPSYLNIYGEHGWSDLTARVEQGPFAGLHTTPQRVSFLQELDVALREQLRPGDRVMFYDHFPAGYLLTDALPGSNSNWQFPSDRFGDGSTQALLDYWKAPEQQPRVVVRMRQLFLWDGGVASLDSGMLPGADAIVEPRYEVAQRHQGFDIMLPRGASMR